MILKVIDQSLDNIFEDPTLVVGSQADKELARAKQAMGLTWVNKVCTSPCLEQAYGSNPYLDQNEVPLACTSAKF
jgi:hypothetical protein